MRPAFSSPRQACAFAALLLFLLGLPLLLGRSRLPGREQLYDSEGWGWGPYPWVRSQIFDETNPIDIAFMGSSHMACAIDTPYVQQQLALRLGHPATVRSLCWSGADFDVLYLVAKDLLEHRKVKLLVFYDETGGGGVRNSLVPLWFRWGEDADTLAGLPLADRAPFYFASILGMPRNLICYLRPNIPADLTRTNSYMLLYNTPNPATRLGASTRRLGFAPVGANFTEFHEFSPRTGITPGDVRIYSPATAPDFLFSDRPVPAWQTVFARQFAALAQSHGCRLVLLHLPVLTETNAVKIEEPKFWPDVLQAPVTMVGIPPAKYFAGLTAEQSRRLYANPGHINANGQAYLTPLLTPTLIKLYEDNSHP